MQSKMAEIPSYFTMIQLRLFLAILRTWKTDYLADSRRFLIRGKIRDFSRTVCSCRSQTANVSPPPERLLYTVFQCVANLQSRATQPRLRASLADHLHSNFEIVCGQEI